MYFRLKIQRAVVRKNRTVERVGRPLMGRFSLLSRPTIATNLQNARIFLIFFKKKKSGTGKPMPPRNLESRNESRLLNYSLPIITGCIMHLHCGSWLGKPFSPVFGSITGGFAISKICPFKTSLWKGLGSALR